MHVDSVFVKNPLVTFPKSVPPRPTKAREPPPARPLAPHASAQHLGAILALPPSAKVPAPFRGRAPPPAPTPLYDLWDDEAAAAAPAAVAAAAAAKRPKPAKSRTVAAPALEICAPGASYHPTLAAHQELVGAAVAVEHMRALQAECRPVRPPALGAAVAAQLAEEMMYAPAYEEDEEAAGPPGGEEEEADGAPRRGARPLSRADRARRQRGRAAEQERAAARLAKRQRRDIEQLKALGAEMEAADAAAAARRARLAGVRAERRAAGPARLGKQRFLAAPIAVPLTDELSGSLRRVVPLPTLLRDRYVALQRAEKIEPRKAPARYTRSKSYIGYEPGARGARELEMHAALMEERRSTRVAQEASKAAAEVAL